MKAIEVDTALLIRDHVLENQAVLGSVNADRADFEAAIRDLSSPDRVSLVGNPFQRREGRLSH